MDDIQTMYKNLRRCYECERVEPCFGCAYNGNKLDILQHLKEIASNEKGNCEDCDHYDGTCTLCPYH